MNAASDISAPKLIFDGDCAFCTTTATWVGARLHRAGGPNADLVPWQFTDLAALGTTAARAQSEVLWLGTDGAIHGGAQAFAHWLQFRGQPYAILGRLIATRPVRPLAAVVYRLIAKNRHRMPGGSPACALPPAGYDAANPGTQAL